MNSIVLKNQDILIKKLGKIFKLKKISKFLYKKKIGIFILLLHIKAKDWPWKNQTLNNDPVKEIPLLWGIVYAPTIKNIEIVYSIHPIKCFPTNYENRNQNSKKNSIVIEKNDLGTLGGCARYYIEQSDRKYDIFEKNPLYCSIFGLPDDCFSLDFEQKMLEKLKNLKEITFWCYDKNEYISKKIEPLLKLNYMKQKFLPSVYFPFVDSPSKFLRGLFKAKDLSFLNSEPWFNQGYELIKKMDTTKENSYRYEEEAIYFIKKKLVFEAIRELLLLYNKSSFKSFKIEKTPKLINNKKEKFEKNLFYLKNKVIRDRKNNIDNFIKYNKNNFDFEKFKRSRFLVIDVEYIHVEYPKKNSNRTFNFPSIITNIIWQGVRNGIDIIINVLKLPCHFCIEKDCDAFQKKIIKFDCLAYADNLYEKQIKFLNNMLIRYEGFKMYSYGKSDFFQIEQLTNFFTNSCESPEFQRKNRKRDKRLIEIFEDLAIKGKSLNDVENDEIKKRFPTWRRKKSKINVNSRFMTRFNSRNWDLRYKEALEACLDDTISAFLFLITQQF